METPSMQREGKSVTELGLPQLFRAALQFLLPITVFTIILSYPYWLPCPSLQNLCHPLLNSLPALLDRKFMFLLCNVILIFISGDSLLVIKELPYSKKKLDVYDEYIIRKHESSLTQVRDIVGVPKSSATKMVLEEKKKKDAESESKAIVVAGGGRGEEELILDGLEREEEEDHLKEEDRRFDEFIARRYENWRREQQQLLNSGAKESREP